MNKKIVAIVLVVALAVTGLFAASTEGTSKKDSSQSVLVSVLIFLSLESMVWVSSISREISLLIS